MQAWTLVRASGHSLPFHPSCLDRLHACFSETIIRHDVMPVSRVCAACVMSLTFVSDCTHVARCAIVAMMPAQGNAHITTDDGVGWQFSREHHCGNKSQGECLCVCGDGGNDDDDGGRVVTILVLVIILV